MLDVWREFTHSKKWNAVTATVATIWAGVAQGSGTVREGFIGTIVTILLGVAAQAAADVGKSKAIIERKVEKHE